MRAAHGFRLLLPLAFLAAALAAQQAAGTPASAAVARPAAHAASHGWLGAAWRRLAGKSARPDPPAIPAAKAPPAPAARPPEYRLGAGDQLAIEVWHQPAISGKVAIRPDGKITLPLAGEIAAAGLTPPELQLLITAKLRAYLAAPSVTVVVEQVKSRAYNVLGRVAHPGAFPLVTPTRVLDALARAGGLAPFSHPSHIYVLRIGPAGACTKLKFDFKRVLAGKDTAEDVFLAPGDTVVVP